MEKLGSERGIEPAICCRKSLFAASPALEIVVCHISSGLVQFHGNLAEYERGIERQLLPAPLLYLSAFFEASRRDYYAGLRGVSERGAWNDWLEYFLLGVARMSEDALSRAVRINEMLAQWQKRVAGDSTNAPLRVVELLGANPFITAKGTAEKLGVAFATAQRAIKRLQRIMMGCR
jgi:hypothetical protein